VNVKLNSLIKSGGGIRSCEARQPVIVRAVVTVRILSRCQILRLFPEDEEFHEKFHLSFFGMGGFLLAVDLTVSSSCMSDVPTAFLY